MSGPRRPALPLRLPRPAGIPIRRDPLIALGLILVWIAGWAASVRADRMLGIEATWIPSVGVLAGDFRVSIEPTARRWAEGINVYLQPVGLAEELFPYPPMIPRLFAWVRLVDPATARGLWMAALVAISLGALAWVVRTRRRLGLDPLCWSWLVALGLYGYPMVTALERGQCDPLVLVVLPLAAWCLGRPERWAEPAAGVLLGVGCWLKYYPTAALLAVALAGRWRALAVAVALAAVVGVHDRVEFLRSVRNGQLLAANVSALPDHVVHPLEHALGVAWPELRRSLPWQPPIAIRGARLVGLVLAPPVLMVAAALLGRRRRGPVPTALLGPTMLWLTAAATFAMPYSNDYNLVPLPLAALAVWDRRDPMVSHFALGAAVLSGIPLRLPMFGTLYLALKLVLLVTVAAALVRRLGASVVVDVPPTDTLQGALTGPHRLGRLASLPDTGSALPLSLSEETDA